MAQLYRYRIDVADPDHAPEYNSEGVVSAEPEEIEAFVADINGRHLYLIDLRPVDTAAIDFARFRLEVGGGLYSLHTSINSEPICAADVDLVREYWRDSYGSEPDEGDFEIADANDHAARDDVDDAGEEFEEDDE